MPGIPSKDASFVRGTPRNYALTIENRIWNDWTPEEQQQYLALTKKYRDGLKKYLEMML